MKQMGNIKIKSERKVRMVELDLDMDDRTMDSMARAGLIMIRRDRGELAAYAFRKALEALVKPNRKKRGNKSH